MEQYVLQPGETRSCLDFFILDDVLLEDTEDLTGQIRGVVNTVGIVDTNPARILLQPRLTTILIMDNDGMFKQLKPVNCK